MSDSHILLASYYQHRSWYNDSFSGSLQSSNYSTAVATRSLSATSIGSLSGDSNSTSNVALIYYENPTGEIAALLEQGFVDVVDVVDVVDAGWVDVTSQESKSIPAEFHNAPIEPDEWPTSKTLSECYVNVTFGVPFTSAANFSGAQVGILFYSPVKGSTPNGSTPDGAGVNVPGDTTLAVGYEVGNFGPGNFSSGARPLHCMILQKLTCLVELPDFNLVEMVYDPNSIHQSDIAVFGGKYVLCVNGTHPAIVSPSIPANPTVPDNAFPFARLASVPSHDQSTTFLYHQMNGTTFAEEKWDVSENTWLPSAYINQLDL